MKTTIALLEKNPRVSDYKINISKKESCELFFVKGTLETVRCTDTCDRQVTVYADHGAYKGDSQFFVYPSTTPEQIAEKIDAAVDKALLINNETFELPGAQTGEYQVPSNFENQDMAALAQQIAAMVFAANQVEGGSLNSVEIFVNRHTDTVCNSRGLNKTQHRYDAMVEAIPTFNGRQQSVELYEQYNFCSLDPDALTAEIAGKMHEVKARCEAVKPELPMDCPVVLNKLELGELFGAFAQDLNYGTVYGHCNLYHKGDKIQKNCAGDPITVWMKGAAEGNVNSSSFDSDGLALGEIRLIHRGTVENYYGSNRMGQYLKETPTGNLRCLCVEPGTADADSLRGTPYLEVMSMSGLQVDFFNDYIGGEIRLAYYHDGTEVRPVTGISISGKLQQVLDHMRLSRKTAIHDGYMGPAQAILTELKIF